MLDKQLGVGPLSLNIAGLGFTDEIQDKLDLVPQIIKAIVAMYIITAVFIILSLFGSCAAIVLINKPRGGGGIIKINLGLTVVALVFLFIGNMVTTLGGKKVVGEVRTLGEKFGLSAKIGDKFLWLSWAAFVLMLLAVCYWLYELVFGEKKRAKEEEPWCRGEVESKDELRVEPKVHYESSRVASDSFSSLERSGPDSSNGNGYDLYNQEGHPQDQYPQDEYQQGYLPSSSYGQGYQPHNKRGYEEPPIVQQQQAGVPEEVSPVSRRNSEYDNIPLTAVSPVEGASNNRPSGRGPQYHY